jgi:ATP diphosphatase
VAAVEFPLSNPLGVPDPSIIRLIAILARLRDPVIGCEWDRAQDFASIAPYTIEEAYEVADAIARADLKDLRAELGDLLLQVVFHARIAEEAGHFDFNDVAAAICAKLEARHPHLFGTLDESGGAQTTPWEALKAQERQARGETSAMDGVALALPALMRADKLQRRAARDGFDWPDTSGPAAKLLEEMDELSRAQTDAEQLEEAGDLLFAAANLVRAHGVAPEDSLRAANAKFERRFRLMESLAAARGTAFAALSLDQQEALWVEVKGLEDAGTTRS